MSHRDTKPYADDVTYPTLPPRDRVRTLSVATEGHGQSPMYSAIFNMLAGCGIVGLPVTYANAGLVFGIGLMLLVAFISVYTLRYENRTYESN